MTLGKIRIMFKDPDVVFDAVEEHVCATTANLVGQLSPEEADAVVEKRTETVRDAMKKFIEYGEYAQIEIDLDAQTARVVPVREE
jgi:putative heme iron utilization protein